MVDSTELGRGAVVPMTTETRDRFLQCFRWASGHADFAAVFRDVQLLAGVGAALASPYRDGKVNAVLAIEARGFVVGALVARELGVGLVLARKPGSVHPRSEREVAGSPDWRGNTVELRVRSGTIGPGDRVLIVDDWIETGSQARTATQLIERLGAHPVGISVLVDGCDAEVRADLRVAGLVRANELPSEL